MFYVSIALSFVLVLCLPLDMKLLLDKQLSEEELDNILGKSLPWGYLLIVIVTALVPVLDLIGSLEPRDLIDLYQSGVALSLIVVSIVSFRLRRQLKSQEE